MASDLGKQFISDAVSASSIGAGQQAGSLMNMILQTQGAIQAENESRVAQERERRRMEHEKELMRVQMEQQDRQAQILQRLQAQRQPQQPADPNVRSTGFRVDDYGRVVDRWRT